MFGKQKQHCLGKHKGVTGGEAMRKGRLGGLGYAMHVCVKVSLCTTAPCTKSMHTESMSVCAAQCGICLA